MNVIANAVVQSVAMAKKIGFWRNLAAALAYTP
jgi:hypothetical protein